MPKAVASGKRLGLSNPWETETWHGTQQMGGNFQGISDDDDGT